MSQLFDDVSRALGEESLPRRESLRRIGLAMTATVLSPLGMQFAQAGKHPKPPKDPCKAFCTCRNKQQRNQCLEACRACNGATNRLVGGCGSYACCGNGQSACDGFCADLSNDPYNCGACGFECDPPGPNEYGGCVAGTCVYACIEGAEDCNGVCTNLSYDPDNCGACGNLCSGDTPNCSQGVCSDCPPGTTSCGGYCTYLDSDLSNCGGCGIVCAGGEECYGGACQPAVPYSGDGTY